LRFGRARGVLDACVDVLGVLTEDGHVDFFRVFHRRWDAGIPADRTQTHVKIEHLAKRHIQRSNAAADRRRQRPLDADEVCAEGVERFVREPVAHRCEGLFAGKDFFPVDAAAALVCLLNGGVEDADAGAPDVGSRTVAFDVRNCRIVGDC
jgi:hypothetical protein